jgi:hypothetical protein
VTARRHVLRATLTAITLAAAAVLHANRAGADDETGPIVVGNTQRAVTPFHMDMPTANFTLDYLNQHDTSSQDGVKTGTTDNLSTEQLDLQTAAYVLSPNIFDMSLAGGFGLEQESYDNAGQNAYTSGQLNSWDFSGTLLRNQGAPLTVYTRQSQAFITPAFSPTLDSTDRDTGANLSIVSNWAPTQFQIYQQEDTQSELDALTSYKSSQDVFHWHTDVVNLPHQTLTWDYNYQNTEEQEDDSPAVRFANTNADLNHAWYFGPQDTSSLTSTAAYQDQTGDLSYSEFRLDEELKLQHTKNFQTHYSYSLDQSTADGDSQTTNAVDVGFIHQLFQSLTTSADFGASLLNESGGNQVEDLNGSVDVNYRKEIPYGLLLADFNVGWQWQYAPTGTSQTTVLNQTETFNDAQPIVLTQPNIDPNSIVLLSSSGVPYLKGSDFTVNTLGSLVQIQRVLGGLILPDSSVLLDYKLLPQPANTTNTGDYGIGARYEIDKGFLIGLTPYARYSVQTQSIDTEQPGAFIPDTYNDTVVGLDYRIWLFTFNAEQEWHDSSLVPYDATRFSARYAQSLDRDTTANLSANYSLIDYYDQGDRVNDSSFSASLRRALNSEWSLDAAALWMNDRDELFGDTDGLEEQLELRWKHNQTEIFGKVRNATLSTNGGDSTFQVFEIGLSREF